MDGAPADQIAAAHPDAWDVVADDLDSLLPWVLTAAVEFLLADTGLTTMRDVAHARLGISRSATSSRSSTAAISFAAAPTACGLPSWWRSTAICCRRSSRR
jgi:hypothetical protein